MLHFPMPTKETEAMQFRPGDVLAYVSIESHCREGTAYVQDSGAAIDTYWRPSGGGDSHRLTESELATASVSFNVNDYDLLERYVSSSRKTWETYRPEDRAQITSQHGLQASLFVRRGAEPHLDTQIENAEAAVLAAEREANSAAYVLERRRDELATLKADREATHA